MAFLWGFEKNGRLVVLFLFRFFFFFSVVLLVCCVDSRVFQGFVQFCSYIF